jgi:exopolysaccharide biosynthesis polyprenyl glycosylphosphotransferase
VNAVGRVESVPPLTWEPAVNEWTAEILRRRATRPLLRRGWLLRRVLPAADLVGLVLAFAVASLAAGGVGGGHLDRDGEALAFLCSLPAWLLLMKLHGLYDRDEPYADCVTSDEAFGVFHVITAGTWLFVLGSAATSLAHPSFAKLALFWGLALVLVPLGRGVARLLCRRSIAFVQNTLIVGSDPVGQLIARKLQMHPEYGFNVVGFVDPQPRKLREDLRHVAVFSGVAQLPQLVRLLDVERVLIAFSDEPHDELLGAIRRLPDLAVQIDIVPRFFEAVGPRVGVHMVEGMPLLVLPPGRLSPSARLLKRTLDLVVATAMLVASAPLLVVLAWLIRRDSPGPVLFRQKRLGQHMREFELLKFRTMRTDADSTAHREYVKATMTSSATLGENGLYKPDLRDAVTRVGAWLRRTSLDELPQLINVLRGDMSLVGPRPCLAYETAHFRPHHFDRFLVPAGITGFWQVSARAASTFGEALDMDVAYARGWSLGLDMRLLARTPLQVLRQRRATA